MMQIHDSNLNLRIDCNVLGRGEGFIPEENHIFGKSVRAFKCNCQGGAFA